MEEILAEYQIWFVSIALTLPRIVVVFTFLPFFADKSMPLMVRSGVALVLSTVVVPGIAAELSLQVLSATDYFFIALKEIFIGILIGYLTATMFWVLTAVGFFIDSQRGAMNPDLFNPAAGGSTTPLGSFLVQVGVTLFFSSGAILIFLGGLYESYITWPVLNYFPSFDWSSADYFLSQIDLLFYLMLLLAGPIVMIMFVAEFGVALVGRFVPQINIFILAMPIKSAIGFFLLALYVSFLVKYIHVELFSFSRIFIELNEVMR